MVGVTKYREVMKIGYTAKFLNKKHGVLSRKTEVEN